MNATSWTASAYSIDLFWPNIIGCLLMAAYWWLFERRQWFDWDSCPARFRWANPLDQLPDACNHPLQDLNTPARWLITQTHLISKSLLLQTVQFKDSNFKIPMLKLHSCNRSRRCFTATCSFTNQNCFAEFGEFLETKETQTQASIESSLYIRHSSKFIRFTNFCI